MPWAVYLDLDGTLIEYASPYERIFERAVDPFVDTVDDGMFDTYSESFFEAFQNHDSTSYRVGMATLCEAYSLDAEPTVLARALVDAEVAASSLADDVLLLCDRLSDPVPTGVLTNGVGAVQRRKLRHHDLIDRFDEVLVSCELGVHKPDPEIFARAKRRLDADRYAYVGDDVEPARRAGFATIHVDDERDSPIDQARSIGIV